MRIAHITATFPPHESGAGRVAFHSALGLAQRHHDVEVFTAKYPGETLKYPDAFKVSHLPTIFRIGNAQLQPALLQLSNFDLLHLHLPFIFGAELIWLNSLLRRIPYVLTYHNDLIGEGNRRLMFDMYCRASLPLVIGNARKIIAVTKDHALNSRAAPLFRKRARDLVEIPNGVDPTAFHPDLVRGAEVRAAVGIPLDSLVVLFVGALDRAHHYRRVDLLMEAVQRLQKSDVYLLLVGDGDMRATYEEISQKLGIASHTRFVGKVANEALSGAYNAADIVVLPSQLQESFGMVLIEAMACGKPVITSDIPGVRSVVRDGIDGLLVQPGDPADLVAKLEILLKDPDRRQAMGAKGRQKVLAKYSWTSIITALEQLYTDTLESKHE